MIPSRISPKGMIGIGFVLVLLGFLLPFLVVIKMIENSFFLSFLAYGAQVSGLILGVIGAANHTMLDRHDKED